MKESVKRQQNEESVKKEFLAAFNPEDKRIKKYLMQDGLVKKLYTRMQKNRIIREYHDQKISGIVPIIPHDHHHGPILNQVEEDQYRVYLPEEVIKHAFDSSSGICFGSMNKKDYNFEDLKKSCNHSHDKD